jgi:hypothetical protein
MPKRRMSQIVTASIEAAAPELSVADVYALASRIVVEWNKRLDSIRKARAYVQKPGYLKLGASWYPKPDLSAISVTYPRVMEEDIKAAYTPTLEQFVELVLLAEGKSAAAAAYRGSHDAYGRGVVQIDDRHRPGSKGEGVATPLGRDWDDE